jgi:hypothetical protein
MGATLNLYTYGSSYEYNMSVLGKDILLINSNFLAINVIGYGNATVPLSSLSIDNSADGVDLEYIRMKYHSFLYRYLLDSVSSPYVREFQFTPSKKYDIISV